MALDTKCIAFRIGDPGADNKQLYVFEAPDAGHGGGLRILQASACEDAAPGSGTSFSLALHRYSSAGTPAVNGTIAAAIGGTAATEWASGVPQSFTISETYSFLNAGEWLVIDYQEDDGGNPTNCCVNIWYTLGK
jgi:hypothetical protein